MEEEKDFLKLESEIFKVLNNIYDPEMPVNIYDLGLIYEINVDDENKVEIVMTLTTPNCPMTKDIIKEVNQKAGKLEGVKEVKINLVFDPPWNKNMMSEEAKLKLGFL